MLDDIQQRAREVIMLVLTRKKDQQLVIQLGEETVLVRVLELNGDRVRLGLTAPRSVTIHREEVARRIQELQAQLGAPVADAIPQS